MNDRLPACFGHAAQLRKMWHDESDVVTRSTVESKRQRVRSRSRLYSCFWIKASRSKQLHTPTNCGAPAARTLNAAAAAGPSLGDVMYWASVETDMCPYEASRLP